MSGRYNQMLTDARAWLADVEVELSPSAVLLERLAAREHQERRRRVAALGLALFVVLAWVLSIVGHPLGSLTCEWARPQDVVRYGIVHVVAFSAGAVLLTWRRTSAQILVRAFWWASVLAATVGSWAQPGTLPILMPVLCVASVLGLWLLGQRPFSVNLEDGQLPLARHRGVVLAMLVFGVADTENLLAAALNHEEPEVLHFAVVQLVSAAAMLVSMWGLFRLRGWGLLALLGTNIVVAGLALGGQLIYDPGFALLFTATAVLQLCLAVPLIRTLLRPAPTTTGGVLRAAARLRLVVLGIALAGGLAGACRSLQPDVLAAHCAED